jgi:hypothetical protein
MGYAVTRMLGKGADISLALAFFLGAFPMQTLLSFFRKISIKRLGIEDAIEKAGSEILKLQGIDRIKAECLATEGVTTICQLAYADPIRLTIRTNLGYSFLVDCISQAQLRIYTGDYHEKWQRLGLRGGFEVINLSSGLESEDVTQKDDANMLIAELAESLGVSRSAVREIIWEVCNDPYMEFVYSSWVSSKKDSIASGSDKG